MSGEEISTNDLRDALTELLKGADLTLLSSKKVRAQLEEKYDTDFTERKKEIDEIILDIIKLEQESKESEKSSSSSSDSDELLPSSPPKKKTVNKKAKAAVKKEKAPPKKKLKAAPKAKADDSSSDEDDKANNNHSIESDGEVNDEEFARRLHEQEFQSRTRSCKKVSVKKKEPRKKPNNDPDKPKRKGGYTEDCILSPILAEVVGQEKMSRPLVVKKLWALAKEKQLFDPSNKQFVICDEQFTTLFGTKRLRMFSVMKYLKNHIKKPES